VEIVICRPSVGERELAGVRAVLESRWLGMGPVAAEFERRVAEVAGVRHAVALTNCSAALHLAVDVLDLQPGDEVVLPPLTHVACGHAVVAAGATPVFCDVDRATGAIDPNDLEGVITERTRAVMPVHYAGFIHHMDEVLTLAQEHGLAVVADGAHAFGSSSGGRPLGALADLTCLSFDPLKTVTCGEGGAIATDDDALAARLRVLRNLGVPADSWSRRASDRPWFYEAVWPGMRYHLCDVNAAIGLAQLERMDELVARKQTLSRRYREALADVEGFTPLLGDLDMTSPFLFAGRVSGGRRDELVVRLAERGIQAWVHFVPLHLQPAFRTYSRPLPATEHLYEEIVSLPLYVDLTDAEQELVIASVRDVLRRAA